MKSQPRRLSRGGLVDRGTPLPFSFDGRAYEGYAGDTLASALLANGVAVVGRSWKYHRPRGVMSCGVEEPSALVQLESGARTIPNVLATTQMLYAGLQARSVNARPDAERDRWRFIDRISRFLPAGFYYKTFMWPARLWPTYEKWLRRMSGLGESPAEPDPDTYDKCNAFCDVLVVGAGVAGLSAARAAARGGLRVMLVEQADEPGGQLRGSDVQVEGQSAGDWIARVRSELSDCPDVTVLVHATAFGYHDGNFLTVQQRLTDHLPLAQRRGRRERLWRVRARHVILATGAHERPLVFGNNDLPGTMLASSVAAYLRRFAVAPGSRAVLFTNNDSAYDAALAMLEAGVAIAAVVDARATVDHPALSRLREAQVALHFGAVVTQAQGRERVTGVTVQGWAAGRLQGPAQHIPCDLVAMSGGWNPVIHLSSQSGARPRWSEQIAAFVPGVPVQSQCSVGACAGSFALEDAIREGQAAGAASAGAATAAPSAPRDAGLAPDSSLNLLPLWRVPQPSGRRGAKQFVDYQNDVAAADLELAVREGYGAIEHAKRYTGMGFGTDQGKLGNVNGAAIVAALRGESIAVVGTTTFRPNFTPVTFGVIAGRELGSRFDPQRRTPIHAWHVAQGALFEPVGQWLRAWYYPKPGESREQTLRRECLAARERVALMDASTLGKIDIQGPDAARFLDRVYTNAWQRLEVGRCRYGLMLDENGMVFDDGVTARLGPEHFLMTTTTGGAARVLAWLEKWHQTEWPELKVYFTSVTDHWATVAVVGPDSRRLLSRVCTDIDLSPQAFPFMSFRSGSVAGVTARVMRISFSGELAYEVNVPAGYARHVWEQLWQAGSDLGITAYGTESMHVLRAEKGYIIVGQDTDGSVTPVDLGMDGLIAKTKDFIGKRSLARSDTARADRKQLVGVLTDEAQTVLAEGAQIIEPGTQTHGLAPMLGHVTSAYFSASLGRSIALALVAGGRSRLGQAVTVVNAAGQAVRATLAPCVFYDPSGERLHG